MGNMKREYTKFEIGDRVVPIDSTELWATGTSLIVVDLPMSTVHTGRSLKLRVQANGCDRVFYTVQPDDAFKKVADPAL